MNRRAATLTVDRCTVQVTAAREDVGQIHFVLHAALWADSEHRILDVDIFPVELHIEYLYLTPFQNCGRVVPVRYGPLVLFGYWFFPIR